jgi:site-specific DNA-methyltransferase (adenine-specific)
VKPYYERAGITIYHGDCREILPHVTADVVVTDPPYGVEFSGKKAKFSDGSVRLRPGGYSIPDTPEYIVSVVAPALRQCIERFGRAVVTPGTRSLWLYPPADDVGCWFSAAGTGIGRWGFTCMQPILYYGKDPHLPSGASANSIGQVYPNSSNEFDHPCAKPMPLVAWLVRKASSPGETVIDPFMGSGTTLRAAKDLGRKAIGIEIEERYCEIAAKRLAQDVFVFE